MRITFITTPPALTGGYRTIAIYAGRLRDRGHEVRVVAQLARSPTAREILRSLRRLRRWPRSHVPCTTYLDRVGIVPRYVPPPGPLTDADVPDGDVVIATWWETAEWVARLSPSKGSKAYFIQGFEVFPGGPAERVEATWRLPFRKIVVSRWLQELARTTYGDEHAALVSNAVDRELFHAPPRGKARVPTVGLVGATIAGKSCHVALKAYELAASRIPGLRLVTFGHEAAIKSLPLPPGAETHIEPPQDRLREIYASCDAWLFSSRMEGFGLPILEAMACRTPVIATPGGAAPELLAEGGGILVRPEDPEDMARAIERVVAMGEPEWTRLSDLALATAVRHNWDDAADQFEAALRDAIQQPAHQPA